MPRGIPKPKPKKKRGRQWFEGKDEKDVVSKLSDVWKLGGTDHEAVFFADISIASLNRYYDVHPELRDLRDRYKQYPNLKSRTTVVKGLDDWGHAWDYLKAKNPAEFKNPENPAGTNNHFSVVINKPDGTSTMESDNQTISSVAIPKG